MPSAASAKLEKQASSGNQTESSSTAENNNSSNNNANTPIRQALITIEHKIRNLEKRKTKLESYRAIQSSGKELSNDQKIAVSKFDEVAQSLEFARDLSKQMLQLATNAEKEQKRQSRKEAVLRTQTEIIKIREVLNIQNILSNFSLHSQIREDFLNGTNGAVKLEEDDIQILEKFYADIQVKRQTTPEDVPFMTSAQKAAEYLSLTIDGRPKQYRETTFENIRSILNNIQECGYLDRFGKISEGGATTDDISGGGEICDEESPEDDEQNDEETETDETTEKVLKLDNKSVNDDADQVTVENVSSSNVSEQSQQQLPQPIVKQQQQSVPSPITTIPQNIGQQTIDVPKFVTEAPSAAAVPAPSFPQQPPPPPQQQQQQSSQQQTAIVSTQGPPPQIPIPIVPTQMVVSASVAQTPQVAQGPPTVVQPNPAAGNPIHFPPTTVRAVEQAYFKQHQYIAQMRPLAEVIGSGNFFFLQDSELDSPDIVPTAGFPPNDGQNQGNASVPISNATTGLPNQSNLPQQAAQTQSQQHQQQQPQLPTMPQSGGITQQQKSQQGQSTNNAPPIPTQTFTNQAFPPIVPPSAIFQPQGVKNPNEISNSQTQMPVFTGPPLPIPQMVVPSAAVQQQSIVVSIAPSSVTSNTPQNSVATVLKTVENQQQQGIITNQQPSLITGPGGASVALPGFTSSVITIGGLVTLKPPENYEKLQKSVQGKNVLSENQIHHKKVDDVVVVKERLSENHPNDWDSNQNLPKAQRVLKKEEESNQWSNEVANNVKTNEWSNSNYDNQMVETNNWNSNSNQNDNVSGYGSRTRNNNFGNRSGGGNRGIRNSAGGGGNATNSGGPPPNGYRGGRPSNSYQQQQNNRNSGMYFRNNNDNTTGGGSSGGTGGYYQNHQNGGYNSGGVGKQDGTNNNTGSYGGSGSMNTGYRPRGGPIPSSNRQQNSGGGGVNSRGADSSGNTGGGGGGSNRSGGPSSNPGGPQPQRNMNSNRPPNSGGGGGMSTNSNRNSGGGAGGPRTTGNYRPPNMRNQHQQHQQQQQDVNV